MARLDDRLHEDLERAARPADPSGLYEDLIRRRERRRVRRKVQAGALALVVVAGTVAGVMGLSRVFGPGGGAAPLRPMSPTPVENGLLAYTAGEITIQEFDGSNARTIPAPAPGLAWHIAWSPDGSRLALAVFGDTDRSLWVIGDKGQDPVRIAEADNVSRPSWHPDGEHLTYSLTNEGSTEIHVTAADGSDDRVVHSEAAPGTYAVFSAAFSPDGSQILFDAGTDSGYDIFLMDVDGSNVRQLTRTGTDYNPSWAPDGSAIVFTRQEGPSESDIFVMSADGSNVQRLTNDGARVTNLNPAFSPDGLSITFEAAPTGGTGPIFVMDGDGSNVHILVKGDVLGFSWQPVPVESTPTGPTTAPGPAEGVDMGMGYVLCDVTPVGEGFLEEGGTAYIGTNLVEGRCPVDVDTTDAVVGLDREGDERFDAVLDGISCSPLCTPFATPDLDGDGTKELLIQNVQFSIAGLQLVDFGVRTSAGDEDSGVFVSVTAPPGDPSNGFEPSVPLQLWIGGDGFELDTLTCEDRADGRVLIVSTASQEPPDSPDAVWKVHETVLRLPTTGVLEIVSSRDYETSIEGGPSFTGDGTLCGTELPYPFSGD